MKSLVTVRTTRIGGRYEYYMPDIGKVRFTHYRNGPLSLEEVETVLFEGRIPADVRNLVLVLPPGITPEEREAREKAFRIASGAK